MLQFLAKNGHLGPFFKFCVAWWNCLHYTTQTRYIAWIKQGISAQRHWPAVKNTTFSRHTASALISFRHHERTTKHGGAPNMEIWKINAHADKLHFLVPKYWYQLLPSYRANTYKPCPDGEKFSLESSRCAAPPNGSWPKCHAVRANLAPLKSTRKRGRFGTDSFFNTCLNSSVFATNNISIFTTDIGDWERRLKTFRRLYLHHNASKLYTWCLKIVLPAKILASIIPST